MTSLSPIALFVYNRPEHTLQTLEALAANDLANESILFIYADGPKENTNPEQLEQIQKVRNIIKSRQWCKDVHIIESDINYGLADSIVKGVTETVHKYGKVIVLEDDIVTSKGFLTYMNEALSLYENEEKVFHVSGYMYPHNKKLPDTFFYNVPLCWGWATWSRAWSFFSSDTRELYYQIFDSNRWDEFNKFGTKDLQSQLENNFTGDLRTWFVKWHASVFLAGGFTIFPKTSFVNNIGFDNSGENCVITNSYNHSDLLLFAKLDKQPLEESEDGELIIKEFYKNRELDFISDNSKISASVKLKIRLISFCRRFLYKCLPELNKLQLTDESNIYNSTIGTKAKLNDKYKISDSIVGNYTYISQNSSIQNATIGKFCSIGPNLVCGWGIHPVNALSTSPMFYSTMNQNGFSLSSTDKIVEMKPIHIGNDVFIGMNVTILDGVTIGDGAVIGAGAVVSKNIPPYAVAFGNPIQIKKYRFDDETVKDLLKVKWWDWTDDRLPEVEKYFNDVEGFVKKYIVNI